MPRPLGTSLVPLREWNTLVRQLRYWRPFQRGANGFACPCCGEELLDTPGRTVEKRKDMTAFRAVKCENPTCKFSGEREIA